MSDPRTSDTKLQFSNGYAEIRGNDLFIAVEGYCLAMPLAKWMENSWPRAERQEPSENASRALQDAVIYDMQRRFEKLQKQYDDLQEIALMMSRRLR